MNTRNFGFWCSKCPTRVFIQTETTGSERDVMALPSVDECPVCDGEMVDLDILTGGDVVPYLNKTTKSVAELHAEWLAGGSRRPWDH
jgi:hypothetical protein